LKEEVQDLTNQNLMLMFHLCMRNKPLLAINRLESMALLEADKGSVIYWGTSYLLFGLKTTFWKENISLQYNEGQTQSQLPTLLD
jgi:hypothetical protein